MQRADGAVLNKRIIAEIQSADVLNGKFHTLSGRTNASLSRGNTLASADIQLIGPVVTSLAVRLQECDDEVGEGTITLMLHLGSHGAQLVRVQGQHGQLAAPPPVMESCPCIPPGNATRGCASCDDVGGEVTQLSISVIVVKRGER